MSTNASLLDAAPEPATAAPPGRAYRCRYLDGTGEFVSRCTAEPAEPPEEGPEVELCETHLARALQLLRRRFEAAGLPDYITQARELLGEADRRITELAQQRAAEQQAMLDRRVADLLASDAERRARSDRVIETLLRPAPQTTDETAEAQR